MKKIFYFLFMLLVLILALVGVTILIVLQKYFMLWVCIVILLCIFGMWLGIILLLRLLARFKMNEFVSKIIEQNPESLENKNETKTLWQQWDDVIRSLKMSKAKDTMPWYLVLGGSESGKTSAIKNAKLNITLYNDVKTIETIATKSCDWWFLDKAVILDTTSRYVVPVDDVKDMGQWNEILRLFIKYRNQEPINGIIVMISANRLLNQTASTLSLRDEGQNIRNRIDSLMKIYFAKFPIYIMITKMDQVFGFSESFLHLTESEINQAAGYLNVDNYDWQKVVENFITTIFNRLSEIRSKAVNQLNNSPAQPGLIILPQEFLALKSGLTEFAKAIFENNPYQEQPLFRGIYFSSAIQDGKSQSTILKNGEEYLKNNISDKNARGLFLRDFFDKVLPSDSDLITPAYNALRLRHFANNKGVTLTLSVLFVATCFYTASYVHNTQILNQFLNKYKGLPQMTGDLPTNLNILNNFQIQIRKLKDAIWFPPPIGLSVNSLDLVKYLESQYVYLYEQGFLNNFYQRLNEEISQLSNRSNYTCPKPLEDNQVSVDVGFLLSSINTIEYYLRNDNLKLNDVNKYSNLAIGFSNVLRLMYPTLTTRIRIGSVAADDYNVYLAWKDKNEIRRKLKTMLEPVYTLLTKNPDWGVVKNQKLFVDYDLTLNELWDNNNLPLGQLLPSLESPIVHPGIFTKNGLAQIKDYFKLIEEAGLTRGDDDPDVKLFWAWYRMSYFQSWKNFISNFSLGENLFQTDSEKLSLAANMGNESNPYQRFLAIAAKELAPDEYLDNPPDWVNLIIELNEIKDNANDRIGKIRINIQQQIFSATKKISNSEVAAKLASLNYMMNAINLFNEYNSSLVQISPYLISDYGYLQFVTQFFSEYNGTAAPKSPVSDALIKFNQFHQLIDQSSTDGKEMVWQLEGGPLDYLLKFLINKASCALEAKWEGDVLGKITGIPNDEVYSLLLDKNNGVLLKFINNTLTPFITHEKWGYTIKTIYGNTPFAQKINFNLEFIEFLNDLQSLNNIKTNVINNQPQYKINIGTVPFAVNKEATTKPYAIILSVQCAEGEQILNNYNYKNESTFDWSPDRCGDTTIRILFPNLTLTKVYSGAMGFPEFLSDFKTGYHQFSSDEFAESDVLQQVYKIDYINVRYIIDNNIPSIKLLNNLTNYIPQTITDCEL